MGRRAQRTGISLRWGPWQRASLPGTYVKRWFWRRAPLSIGAPLEGIGGGGGGGPSRAHSATAT